MTRIVDWAASHARMVIACLILSLTTGGLAYVGLPKEGAPDIEIPAYFVSVVFPGISAEDSERLLVKPLEARLKDVDGLDELFAVADEGYAGVSLLFDFGLDRSATLAEIRDLVDRAEAEFPEGGNKPSINEFSFSELPILVIGLKGSVPDRTLMQVADELKEEIEELEEVLEVGLTGMREEMVEVIIDPLQLEAYGVAANDIIGIVSRNNRLIAAGEVQTGRGAFAVKIPSSFEHPSDVYDIPLKVNGDRVVTLGDVSEIRMTFGDRTAISRNNGKSTIALQVVKRKGYNLIDTSANVIRVAEELRQSWPPSLRDAVDYEITQNLSRRVQDMVDQLENSVLTAVSLVMVVVLAILGIRSALLVGFAIPSSFLLCFSFLALMSISISNIVMFALILAVGMLVDSAIVIVELADRRIREGTTPMLAFVSAAKRMFWPILSSTATTLCAFLPMLFWPGVAGQFMGTMPITIIFVLTASMFVALIFLPVVGGISGRISNRFARMSNLLGQMHFLVRTMFLLANLALLFGSAMLALQPGTVAIPPLRAAGLNESLPFFILFVVLSVSLTVIMKSFSFRIRSPQFRFRRRRSIVAAGTRLLVGNPIMPVVCIVAVLAAVVGTFQLYRANNLGVSFFVDTEPETVNFYVRARGNLSLQEKDDLVRQVESVVIATEGVANVFAYAGAAGLSSDLGPGGSSKPNDTVGELRIEFLPWEQRQAIGGLVSDTNNILEQIESSASEIPGIYIDFQVETNGPSGGKPVHLRLLGENWDALLAAAGAVRHKFENTKGLVLVDDTRPLPGIDWKIEVDVERAGRYGTDVATVGGLVQLVTRGISVGTMRTDTSDKEIDIRVRFPESDRHLSTLDELRVNSRNGLVPLSNFVTRTPVTSVGQISRFNQSRYIDVKADMRFGLRNEDGAPITPTERIQYLDEWLSTDADLPNGIEWTWTGDQQSQSESQEFLMKAFAGALGLMFAVLLAQFNSLYQAILVLLAVVMSTTGVLLGMVVLQQPFSIIMTGLGIVALAGIVVNNNIVLIDTFQEYARFMPKIEAIIRTVETRLRPVLLTSITTVAGLTPMMFGFSIDIVGGGYAVDTPSALWWKSLAAAVVFGLSTATVLTLVFTPAMLALPEWARKGSYGASRLLFALVGGRRSRTARDLGVQRALRKAGNPTILWNQELADDNAEALDDSGGINAGKPEQDQTLDVERQEADTRQPTLGGGTFAPPSGLTAAE